MMKFIVFSTKILPRITTVLVENMRIIGWRVKKDRMAQ